MKKKLITARALITGNTVSKFDEVKWSVLNDAPYAPARPTRLRAKIFNAPYAPIILTRQNDGISNSTQIWSGRTKLDST